MDRLRQTAQVAARMWPAGRATTLRIARPSPQKGRFKKNPGEDRSATKGMKNKKEPAARKPNAELPPPVGPHGDGPWRTTEFGRGRKPAYPGDTGSSGFLFVHKRPGGWRCSFVSDGYRFVRGTACLRLAGLVARMAAAGADPEEFRESGGINLASAPPSSEVRYVNQGYSLFRLLSLGKESGSPQWVAVDEWVARRLRGYSWFQPASMAKTRSLAAFRPVVRVDRAARKVALSWVSLEDQMGLAGRRAVPGTYLAPDGSQVLDFRDPETPPERRAKAMTKAPYGTVGRRRAKSCRGTPTGQDGAFAPKGKKLPDSLRPRTLPAEGSMVVERTYESAVVHIVEVGVVSSTRPAYRTVVEKTGMTPGLSPDAAGRLPKPPLWSPEQD